MHIAAHVEMGTGQLILPPEEVNCHKLNCEQDWIICETLKSLTKWTAGHHLYLLTMMLFHSATETDEFLVW